METVNGTFIMKGCEADSPLRLRSIEDLYKLVEDIGFMPLFANSIIGFSVEERVTADQWWTGDAFQDDAYKRKATQWCEENGIEYE